MNIYLTRHGETKWNLIGKIQGNLNSDLTEKGIESAEKLADRLKNIDFDVIYTSTQKRAVDTAEIISKGRIKIIETDDLKELAVGDWSGLYYEEIIKNYGEDFHDYTKNPHLYVPKNGGETYENLERRLKKFLKDIIKDGYENSLVITHGVTYMMLLNIIEKKPIKNLSDRKLPTGTALSKIIYENSKFIIEFEDDTSHLN